MIICFCSVPSSSVSSDRSKLLSTRRHLMIKFWSMISGKDRLSNKWTDFFWNRPPLHRMCLIFFILSIFVIWCTHTFLFLLLPFSSILLPCVKTILIVIRIATFSSSSKACWRPNWTNFCVVNWLKMDIPVLMFVRPPTRPKSSSWPLEPRVCWERRAVVSRNWPRLSRRGSTFPKTPSA